MKILGVAAYYHDSAAALIEDGHIIAAAQEERFTRKKHDESFPQNAIAFCLEEAELSINDLDAIVFYDKPFLKFERIIETFMENPASGWWQFITALPGWLKKKLFIKDVLKGAIAELGDVDWNKTQLLFSKHHLSHAASCFYPSNFKESAILTIDGVGEWATASIAKGQDGKVENLQEVHFPNSLGLLYSAFTYFLGFKVNSGEYKLMGLAPYGVTNPALVERFYKRLNEEVIEIFEDGSIQLNQKYFTYQTSSKMIREAKFEALFGFSKRKEESQIEEEHYCLALALQQVTEDVVLAMARQAKKITASSNLCLAGGVALNCVANGRLAEEGIFENIYIQPAAGDAGNALGGAMAAYYMHFNQDRLYTQSFDQMFWSRLGPAFSVKTIQRALSNYKLNYDEMEQSAMVKLSAELLSKGNIVAWFQGRMEFGPRALGGRSILGNPMLSETQSKLNLKVKKRESFRPFAPIMLEGEFEKYFGRSNKSPYMLFVHKLLPEHQLENTSESSKLIDKINQERSKISAVTHIDYSARIQTVNQESDQLMVELLEAFKALTGEGILVNTSFNLRGEPIVCSPSDAIKTFLSTEIDVLILGNHIIKRENNLDLLGKHVKVNKD